MAGVFRKAMVWLGLAPDEEYDDYGYDDQSMRPMSGRGPGPYGQAPGAPGAPGGGPVNPYGPGRSARGPAEPDEGLAMQPRPARPSASVRALPSRNMPSDPREPRSPQRERTPTVRPMRPSSAKPTVVEPTSFDNAKEVADRFKADQPVVMDLSEVDRDLARRLIDFASGICYALGGHMERVSPGVYLLTPSGVEVSDEERRRLRSGR